ncbi:MAG TPA: YabP/YqfC family sporulation protein, partial [Oscillospiraceae bacterium]|nr:YabP/YqfC family sporulation protein [Oscillospiraceae bacterium]
FHKMPGENLLSGGGSMKEVGQAEERPHWVKIDGREKLSAAGIVSLEGFDEREIHAALPDSILVIGGRNLKVTSFSAETGDLSAEGKIDWLRYSGRLPRRAGFLAKLSR